MDYTGGVMETTYSTVAPPHGGGRTEAAATQGVAANHCLSGKGHTPGFDGHDLIEDWNRLPP